MMIEEQHSHKPEEIKKRLSAGPKPNYLREWVYGGIDGVVTTFAIVAGVTGASLAPVIVVILGLANLIGDGFSMAAGAFSSARTDADIYEKLRRIENNHINKDPDGEKEEIRQIYAAKGFEGEDLERLVAIITDNRDVWIDVMMNEEYGITRELKSPLKIGGHTFAAFVVFGFIPLLPFFLRIEYAFTWALVMAAVTFFAIGSIKSRWAVHPWWRQGAETFFIGSVAAGLAFLIGYALQSLGL